MKSKKLWIKRFLLLLREREGQRERPNSSLSSLPLLSIWTQLEISISFFRLISIHGRCAVACDQLIWHSVKGKNPDLTLADKRQHVIPRADPHRRPVLLPSYSIWHISSPFAPKNLKLQNIFINFNTFKQDIIVLVVAKAFYLWWRNLNFVLKNEAFLFRFTINVLEVIFMRM